MRRQNFERALIRDLWLLIDCDRGFVIAARAELARNQNDQRYDKRVRVREFAGLPNQQEIR